MMQLFKCGSYSVFKKSLKTDLDNMKKKSPQKLLIIDPNFFSMYWPAAKMAQKQKSCSTKSPLML